MGGIGNDELENPMLCIRGESTRDLGMVLAYN